jgi:hypothetical protein
MNQLIDNIEKVHTTVLGVARIQSNLGITKEDIVEWCKKNILEHENSITRKGKNWYITCEDCIITVNAFSYTIITAHKVKKYRNGL